MSKKKKNSSAAENLIESLMDDLKDIHDETSYKSAISEDEFAGLPGLEDDENRLENTNLSDKLWKNIENGVEKEIVSAEFTGGISEAPEFDMPDGLAVGPTAHEERPREEFLVEPIAAPIPPIPIVESVSEFSPPQVLAAPLPSPDDEATRPVGGFVGGGEDKTMSIQQDLGLASATMGTEAEKTVAVEGFANARVGARASKDVDVKVSIGSHRGSRGGANVLTSVDASLAQAENLKLAQQRILELEKEVEHLRAENEELASAGEIIRSRADEFGIRISALEKEKIEIQESAQSEMLVLKGNLQYKENEVAKARVKVEELETRLKSDFKKIRVRERELENRLELLRAEKSALVRSKDEYILEQKRKIDQLTQELDNYRKKCLELNKTIEANQDQVKRTERALRLALTNLEAKEENNVPLKKAE